MPLRGSISHDCLCARAAETREYRLSLHSESEWSAGCAPCGEPEEHESLNSKFQEPLGMLPDPGNRSPRLFLIEGHLSHARFFSADVAVQQRFKPLQKALPFILMVV